MADNPYVNKVIYGNEVLIDLSEDTVTENTLKRGATAHTRSGEQITGELDVLPSGGSDGDVLVKNGATDYDAKWTNTPPQMGSLAYIEQTSSVSKQGGYQPGEYLVYNGQLYKVGSTAISQGQTLTPGGNITKVRVMDEVSSALKYGMGTATLATAITAQQGRAVAFQFSTSSIQNASRIRVVTSMAGSAFSNPAGIVVTGMRYTDTTFYVYAYMAATSETVPEGTSITIRYLYE